MNTENLHIGMVKQVECSEAERDKREEQLIDRCKAENPLAGKEQCKIPKYLGGTYRNGTPPYMAARLLGRSDLKMLAKNYHHTTSDTLETALMKLQITQKSCRKDHGNAP